MPGIIDDIKNMYRTGNALIKLIFINTAIFVFFQLVYLVYVLANERFAFPITRWMSMPSIPSELLTKPWTVITYMFYHEELLHFIFNILNLYWFGKIFLIYFNEKQMVSLYLLGGIVGGLTYFLFYNLFPTVFHPGILMGASASIIAIMIAVAFYAPNFRINLLFIGEVKLIYVGIFSIVLFIIMISSSNAGGNLAHLGGAFFGYLWATQYKRGGDFMAGFTRFQDSMFSVFKPSKLKITHKRPVDDFEYNKGKLMNQKEIDRILDKISKHGYDHLTKDEKDTLFRMSQKNN